MPKKKTLTFRTIADAFLAERVVTASHTNNVRRIADRVTEVSSDGINRYLKLRLQERKATTVRTERSILLTLSRWAWDRGMIEDPPRGVLKIKASKPPTKAWSVDQLRVVLEETRKLDATRTRKGVSLGVFLRAWCLLGYECGARFGDLMSMRGDHLDGDAVQWTQSKTGDSITRILSPACVQACREMLAMSPDGRILGWVCRPRQAQRQMRQLLDKAGVGGTSKWLRRSGATHCEIAKPGSGRLHLGHRSVGLFEQAYADWSQLRANAPRTPTLMD